MGEGFNLGFLFILHFLVELFQKHPEKRWNNRGVFEGLKFSFSLDHEAGECNYVITILIFRVLFFFKFSKSERAATSLTLRGTHLSNLNLMFIKMHVYVKSVKTTLLLFFPTNDQAGSLYFQIKFPLIYLTRYFI